MIVEVRNGVVTKHVSLPDDSLVKHGRTNVERIAFRFVYGRKETDYNELAHNVRILEVAEIHPQSAGLLLELR